MLKQFYIETIVPNKIEYKLSVIAETVPEAKALFKLILSTDHSSVFLCNPRKYVIGSEYLHHKYGSIILTEKSNGEYLYNNLPKYLKMFVYHSFDHYCSGTWEEFIKNADVNVCNDLNLITEQDKYEHNINVHIQ
jgi:hypothetical protein